MEIRKASVQDLDQIMQIYEKAREFMRTNGNAEQWGDEYPSRELYAVVHRVASTGIVKGAASYCLDWAYSQIPNIRMDTYADNIPMQRLLEKCGFQYCGSFERVGLDKWMAYHRA